MIALALLLLLIYVLSGIRGEEICDASDVCAVDIKESLKDIEVVVPKGC